MMCANPDCDKPVHARGLCSTHYGHIWRNRSGQSQDNQRAYSRRRDEALRVLAKRHRAELLQILRGLEMAERRQRLREANARILAERRVA
jgi:hypothetical protein